MVGLLIGGLVVICGIFYSFFVSNKWSFVDEKNGLFSRGIFGNFVFGFFFFLCIEFVDF